MKTLNCLMILLVMPSLSWAIDINQALEGLRDPFEERIPQQPAAQAVVPMRDVPMPAYTAAPVQQYQPVSQAPLPVLQPQYSPPAVVQEKPNFTVEGIIWSDTIHAAIINGQMIGVGDKIANATVVDVNRDGVIVDVNGQQFTMPVQ